MTATLKSLGNGAFFSTARLRQTPPLFPRCVRSAPRAFRAFPTKTTRDPHTVSRLPAQPHPLPDADASALSVSPANASVSVGIPRVPPVMVSPPVLFKQIAGYFSMVSMVRCVLVNTQMSAAMAMDSFTISEGVMDV